MDSSWSIARPDLDQARLLANELALAQPTALVMVGRGLGDPDIARRFLEPRLSALRPPEGMAGFARALERIARAVRTGEPIGVFGDYDVDGVTTAALLTSFLRACGATVHVRVARREAGYGFGVVDALALADLGCSLVVTGDCGTSDHEALVAARQRAVDTIVVDHHQVPAGPSAAFALINPHQAGCAFPFKGLCSVGVGFYLAAALRSRLRAEGHFTGAPPDPRDWLDLVAIGTIADLAPLVEENRILVAAGLRLLAGRRRPGLAALMARAALERAPSAFDVGFRIAPRLNAPGRLGDAEPALRLLLAQDASQGDVAAAECEAANQRRQDIQKTVLEEAVAAVERGEAGASALVVAGQSWHPGVVGIVAAKLVERYGRPAAVLAGDGRVYRGSVRSLGGFHAQRALARCSEHLERYGGHEGAAGLTVSAERLSGFRAAWEEAARQALPATPDGAAGSNPLLVDAEVALTDIDERVASEIERLAPFGKGNPEPILAARAHTERTRIVGEDHLQLVLRDGSQVRRDAIAFRLGSRDPGGGASVRVAFIPEIDEFRGQRRLRLRVRDLAANV
jgi:single-stranded-DNA-specific exonuclease